MTIRVVDQKPDFKTIKWKNTVVGCVYQSPTDTLVVLRSQTSFVPGKLNATCLRAGASGTGSKVGDIWEPGEESVWIPVVMEATVTGVTAQ